MNKDRVLILSNHHRRSLYFEDSIRRLQLDGYSNIVIQDTGNEAWGKYKGPLTTYIAIGDVPYDIGMVNFKKHIHTDCDILVFLDNDLFLSGTKHFNQYLEDFYNGKYDFACHHVSSSCYTNNYHFQGSIALVPKQIFEPADIYPGFCPNPHWENAYLIIKKQMWDKLSEDDVSHGRKWIKALVREEARLGAHKANYRMTYSHFGNEWFHVGNLMTYYYRLERNQSFDADSELDMSRLGYFVDMYQKYKTVDFPSGFYSKLIHACPNGNMDIPLEAWGRLIKGTCMENWRTIDG